MDKPLNCPNCHAVVVANANFCEECGARLSPGPEDSATPAPILDPGTGPQPCGNCGAGPAAIDAQGFCSRCGLQRLPPPRDHLECDQGPGMAGVSDRGVRHFRNEDFFSTEEEAGYRVAVVCDGVSNSPRADEVSAAAAVAIRDALTAGLQANEPDLPGLMEAAFAKAQGAVAALISLHSIPEETTVTDLPATTAVAALARTSPIMPGADGEIIVGWIGDSRVYFVDRRGGARLLTKDHSWINEVLDAGTMTRTEALGSRNAHTVTKTLGGEPGENGRPDAPSVTRVSLSEPGWLILCTDGLWNYAPEPPELAAWVRRLLPGPADALALCRALTAEAVRLGGRDNVTVVALAV